MYYKSSTIFYNILGFRGHEENAYELESSIN